MEDPDPIPCKENVFADGPGMGRLSSRLMLAAATSFLVSGATCHPRRFPYTDAESPFQQSTSCSMVRIARLKYASMGTGKI